VLHELAGLPRLIEPDDLAIVVDQRPAAGDLVGDLVDALASVTLQVEVGLVFERAVLAELEVGPVGALWHGLLLCSGGGYGLVLGYHDHEGSSLA
jgi:hypothetical protein